MSTAPTDTVLLQQASTVKTKELKVLLQNVVRRNKELHNSTHKDGNPQIKEVALKAQERVAVAEAVLEALNGNPLSLKILAG